MKEIGAMFCLRSFMCERERKKRVYGQSIGLMRFSVFFDIDAV